MCYVPIFVLVSCKSASSQDRESVSESLTNLSMGVRVDSDVLEEGSLLPLPVDLFQVRRDLQESSIDRLQTASDQASHSVEGSTCCHCPDAQQSADQTEC